VLLDDGGNAQGVVRKGTSNGPHAVTASKKGAGEPSPSVACRSPPGRLLVYYAIMLKGSCLCGAVSFEVAGTLPQPDACHCTQCRRFSGHYFVSADVPRAAVTIHNDANVTWYHSSERVRRGFCATCGASLFFDPVDQAKHAWIAIAMGAFDPPTNTHIAKHIFVAEKGDYYDIGDGLPQSLRPSPGQ
jgi:hypothetical protein